MMTTEDFAKKGEVIHPNITPVHLSDKFSSATPADDDDSESEDKVVIPDSLALKSFNS
jgi:hypothetical protein